MHSVNWSQIALQNMLLLVQNVVYVISRENYCSTSASSPILEENVFDFWWRYKSSFTIVRRHTLIENVVLKVPHRLQTCT